MTFILWNKHIRGCNGTKCVVADPEYGTLVEYSDHMLDEKDGISSMSIIVAVFEIIFLVTINDTNSGRFN